MNETTLRTLLHDVAAETPETTAVDSYLAAETARRQLRSRQRLVTIGAAALVLLVTVAAVVVAAVVRDRPAPPVVPGPKPSAPPAPTAFDPADTRLQMGFLPPGFDRWVRRLESPGVRFQTTKDNTSGREIDVYLAARGARLASAPRMDGFAEPTDPNPDDRIAGPTVRGRESTWFPRDIAAGKNRAGELRFTWAPGALGSVTLWDVGDAMNVAAKIAETLRVDVGVPTALPFTMIRPKVPLTRLEIAHYDRYSAPDGASAFSFVYSAKDEVGPGIDIQVDTVTAALSPDRRIGPWQVDTVNRNGATSYSFQAEPETFVQLRPRAERSSAEEIQAALKLTEDIIASFRMTGKMRHPSTWRS
ncbi:hypothetical protein [Cryptosporangium minutisporangium]|uniref:Uncharacterized protein n=1 Tax=Cryptosporangium minutisporangium TaxID=113569 RepID=A0ABP6SVK8_9ACTN